MSEQSEKIEELRSELRLLEIRRRQLIDDITRLEKECSVKINPIDTLNTKVPSVQSILTNRSTSEEKIRCFRSLFCGREDVFARRFQSQKTGRSGYQPVCKNEWIKGICNKPRIKCTNCEFREFIPISDQIIEWHLRGHTPSERADKEFVVGIYPMLEDETCWFLAVDFDKSTWQDDVSAFRQTCLEMCMPVSVERSRSGNGSHAWLFFSEPISSATARKMGTYLLTETMERRPEIDFDSYDRFFPNQDTMPRGGFGNLIALPLQKKPRELDNSVFLDENLIPYSDQWEYLSSVIKISPAEVKKIISIAIKNDRITGVRMPVIDETEEKPWEAPPFRKEKVKIIGPFPETIDIVYANQIFIPKKELSPSLHNHIVRIAAFQNPEFYQKQAMRMPVYNIPRIISCAENFPKHIALPRGCLGELMDLLKELKIKALVQDERFAGKHLDCTFSGELYPEQQHAADALLEHDNGILAATTAFGKTVVASYIIAKRKTNTLILVHRRQLMEQWLTRIKMFLNLEVKDIGQIGAGKYKPTNHVDVAIIQSLTQKGKVKDIVAHYGQLVIDECHHISAPSFEAIAREFKGKYVIGLSATITRKDGHHPIIHMNCGPIRYKVNEKKRADSRPFQHQLIVRRTSFRLPITMPQKESLTISEIYSMLINDAERNKTIIEDVFQSLSKKRFPVLLTERREHLEYFRNFFEDRVKNLVVFKGGMGKKQLATAQEKLESFSEDEPGLILATGRYLGEGFDNARLDTLFLAFPVSWKGIIVQYAGRLHRIHHKKRKVIIYDYADLDVPMLSKMFQRRLKGYKAIGYELKIS